MGLTAPASLDFSSTALGRSFSVLAPELQQTFSIGDVRVIPEIDPDAFAGVASLLVAALALVERRNHRPVASEA